MYKKYLEDQIIREEDNVYYATWKLCRSNATLIVVDQEDKYKGVLGFPEIERSFCDTSLKMVKDIYNSNGSFLYDGEGGVIFTAMGEICLARKKFIMFL